MGVAAGTGAVAVVVVVQDMVDCLGGRPLEGRDGITLWRSDKEAGEQPLDFGFPSADLLPR